MPNENEDPSTTTDEKQPEGTPAVETPPEGEQAGEQTPEGNEPPKLSHEDALKELTRTRAEAANYRTKLREAEQKLASAKSPEEFEEAKAELSSKVAELERSLLVTAVASEHKLPAEQTTILTALAEAGKSEDELKAFAKTLAASVEPEVIPGHLSGGLNPTDDEDAEGLDPRALAAKHGRRKR